MNLSSQLDNTCPISDVAEAIRGLRQYYSAEARDSGAFTPPDCYELGMSLIEQSKLADIGEGQTLKVRDDIWKRVQIPAHSWCLGAGDRSLRNYSEFESQSHPHHFHTEFRIGSQKIHVDYISYFTWGPYMGACEYRFYLDRTLVSRGGHEHKPFVGPVSRGEPAAVRVGQHLLIASHRVLKQLPSHDDHALTLWQILAST